MNTTKRIISMVLCLVMCLSFFAGVPVYAENGNEEPELAEIVTSEADGGEAGQDEEAEVILPEADGGEAEDGGEIAEAEPEQGEELPEDKELLESGSDTALPDGADGSQTSGKCGDNVTWTYDGATCTLTVSGSGKMWDFNDFGENYPEWVKYRLDIIKIVFEGTVENVGARAFNAAISDVEEIQFSDSIVTIGERAFTSHGALKYVSLPPKLREIGNNAFSGCEISQVTLPESIRKIGNNAFRETTTLRFDMTEAEFRYYNVSVGSGNCTPYFFLKARGQCGDKAYYKIDASDDLTIYGSGSTYDFGTTGNRPPWESWASSALAYNFLYIAEGITRIGNNAFYCTAETSFGSLFLSNSLKEIGDGAFYGCTSLGYIDDTSGIKTIGSRAFYGCTSLKTVPGANSLETIGDEAFARSGITTVTLPAGMKTVGNSAFANCGQLSSVNFGTCESIGSGAFANCGSLKSIQLPATLRSIGSNAFYKTGLSSVKIPDGVSEIPDTAFEGCKDLTTVNLNKCSSIGNRAFAECGLTAVDLGVCASVGSGAFSSCKNLSSVRFSDQLEYIGDKAFESTAIKEVKTGKNLREISTRAFNYCAALEKVELEKCETLGSFAFAECGKLAEVRLPEGLGSINANVFENAGIVEIRFPSTLQAIHSRAFRNCASIKTIFVNMTESAWKNITIEEGNDALNGESVRYYYAGEYGSCGDKTYWLYERDTAELNVYGSDEISYRGWTNLLNNKAVGVVLADEITGICDTAFSGFAVLKNIRLPASLQSIGMSAFESCVSLESVVLPENLQSIGAFAFKGCTSLESFDASESKLTKIDTSTFEGDTALNAILFPDTLQEIGGSAFKGCTGLTGIALPSGMKIIQDSLFALCSNLTSVTIPPSVTSIGNSAFEGCTAFTDVYYGGSKTLWNTLKENIGSNNEPFCTANVHFTFVGSGDCGDQGDNVKWTLDEDGLLTITGEGAMADYTNGSLVPWYASRDFVRSVVIESGVTSIGDMAFYTCKNLASVSIPNTVTAIGADAFVNDANLLNIAIPDSVKTLGVRAFRSCSGLTQVTLSSGLTCIADSLFYDCENLQKVTIPSGVTVIDGYAFYSCDSLAEINIPDGVTHIGEKAFINCTSLVEFPIPASVISVGYAAFENAGAMATKTVTATSDNGAGKTIAFVSGGGTYPTGSTVTVSCPKVIGYDFVGWYLIDGDGKETKLDETGLSVSFLLLSDTKLAAKYKPSSDTFFTLRISGERFTVSRSGGKDYGTQRTSFVGQLAANSTVTVEYVGTKPFLYWENEYSKIVSKSSVYTFTMSSGTRLTAVCADSTFSDEAFVIFKSAFDQVLSACYYNTGSEILFPLAPAKTGKVFTGWSMSEQQIKAAMSTEDVIEVMPHYADSGKTYQVTVKYRFNGGTETEGFVSDPVPTGDKCTVTAPDTENEQSFSYWALENGTVLSYSPSYSVSSTQDIKVYACYGFNTEAEPVISMTAAVFDNGRLSFTSTRNVPADYTVTGHGILYGYVSTEKTDAEMLNVLTLDNEKVSKGTSNSTANNGQFTININNPTSGKRYYARAYMTLTNPNGEAEVVYSKNVVSYEVKAE